MDRYFKRASQFLFLLFILIQATGMNNPATATMATSGSKTEPIYQEVAPGSVRANTILWIAPSPQTYRF